MPLKSYLLGSVALCGALAAVAPAFAAIHMAAQPRSSSMVDLGPVSLGQAAAPARRGTS
jgi:hypothetical protein